MINREIHLIEQIKFNYLHSLNMIKYINNYYIRCINGHELTNGKENKNKLICLTCIGDCINECLIDNNFSKYYNNEQFYLYKFNYFNCICEYHFTGMNYINPIINYKGIPNYFDCKGICNDCVKGIPKLNNYIQTIKYNITKLI